MKMEWKLFAGVSLALAIAGVAAAQSVDGPDGHFTIQEPAQLDADEARAIYEEAVGDLARGYAASRDPTAVDYLGWRLHNTSPYVSATHGNRYVNNYANMIAKDYERLAPGETLPTGSIIAKDSLTVNDEREVFPGALFIMEKLTVGANPATGDWRYIMIMPDGSMFGDTKGEGADNVVFCHECHVGVADNDYLFGVPDEVERVFDD